MTCGQWSDVIKRFGNGSTIAFKIYLPLSSARHNTIDFYLGSMGYKVEKAVAPHSSTLAWKIPWTEKPGRLQSMGLQRVGHDWATSLSLFTFMHWRRKWQPTPVILPGESQGRGSLVGCHLWGRIELDTTKQLSSSIIYKGQWEKVTQVFINRRMGKQHGDVYIQRHVI